MMLRACCSQPGVYWFLGSAWCQEMPSEDGGGPLPNVFVSNVVTGQWIISSNDKTTVSASLSFLINFYHFKWPGLSELKVRQFSHEFEEITFFIFSVLGRIFFGLSFFPICYCWNSQSKLSWQSDKGYSPITNYMLLYSNCVSQLFMLWVFCGIN